MAQCLTTGTGQRYDPETETLIPTHGGGFDVATLDGLDTARTLTRRYDGSPCHDRGPDVVAFSGQMSNPQVDMNLSQTLQAKNPQAVAFDLAQITSSANRTRVEPGLPASTMSKGSRMHVATSTETMYGVSHADASQAHPDQALRALREAVGEKAYSEWCAGILAAFRTPEVLRSKVHGISVRWARDDWHKLGDDALSCPQDGAAWPMLALWQAGRDGRAPRGWQPSEQLARELVSHLSELPHQRTSATRFLLGLWRTSEGLGLVREALSALQEAWRPSENENQPTRLTSAVRRLTPEECEKLQGFSPGYTLVPYRGRMMADGPRYKALGNSMAVPCMLWIGRRIQMVEEMAA